MKLSAQKPSCKRQDSLPAEALLAAAMRADSAHYQRHVKTVIEFGIAPEGSVMRADDVLVRARRRPLEAAESIFSSGYAR
jgi:hypothetical protein